MATYYDESFPKAKAEASWLFPLLSLNDVTPEDLYTLVGKIKVISVPKNDRIWIEKFYGDYRRHYTLGEIE